MKRHLIVLYVSVVVLLMAGRVAWQNCIWELMSAVSAAAIVGAILILGWRVIRMHPDAGDEIMLHGELLAATRTTMIVICVGVLIAGFGDVFGKTLFGCR
jgi:hypothetical protein